MKFTLTKTNLVLFLLLTHLLFSQENSVGSTSKQKFTLSGIVSDKNTKETLIGASVFIPELKSSALTNEYGFYSITIPKGSYTIQISYVGYTTVSERLELDKIKKIDFSLAQEGQQLEEVIVTNEKKTSNIKKPEMSVNKLSGTAIKKIPVVLGEADVLKALLTLPGVTNAGEGQSGFNVRGGGADQNLILLDEATIFNSSHVFGFFSVFNPDVIKDLKLYKGGIPARFGGRASSVLDIYQKDGNKNAFGISGGIGLVSSRLLLEGPIVKDKSSFLLAGRSSYAHLFLKLADNPNLAYFYDLNTKINYKLNQNNNLFLSGYFCLDVFSINDSFVNTYGNTTLNLRWNHLFSDQLFSNLSLIYSDYYYGLDLDLIGFLWNSGIKNYNIKYDFKNYISDKTKLNYGVNGIYYDFNPGIIEPSNATSGITYRALDKKFAFEPSVYIDADQKISENLSVSYGLRYSLFYRLGNSTVNIYANNQPVVFNIESQIYEKATPIDTKQYGNNKSIANYSNLEPRFATSYQLNENQSIKASYNRMTQYLQLISNTASPTPLDVWTPSDQYIKPQILDQVAVGYFKNFSNDAYSLEIESFYKKTKNRIDYIDGADLIANEAIEQIVLNGKMRAYGLEVLLRKNSGKLSGWIAYTLSRSEQQTPGRNATETGINNGNWYRSGYDKLHNLSITSTYEHSKKWNFGANFVLQTGQPITLPNGQYEYGLNGPNEQPITIPSYGLRNGNSLPAYHHLDVSATYVPKSNKKRTWRGEWVFSIYNLYGRKNAASISFRQNETSGTNEAVRLSIFGIVPGISYNFKM
jgi:hypothetical protein